MQLDPYYNNYIIYNKRNVGKILVIVHNQGTIEDISGIKKPCITNQKGVDKKGNKTKGTSIMKKESKVNKRTLFTKLQIFHKMFLF